MTDAARTSNETSTQTRDADRGPLSAHDSGTQRASPSHLAFAVLVVAMVLRIAHLGESSQGPLMLDMIPMIDSQYYEQQARYISEGDLLGSEAFFLAPLYQYSLAIPYRLLRTTAPDGSFVYNITAVRYIQCLFGAATCWLIFWLGYLTFGRLAGAVAGFAAAVYGVFLYYDGIIMPTSQILFLHVLALVLLQLAVRRRAAWWWVVSGVTLGLCALAHGTALLLVVGVLGWILVGQPRDERKTGLRRCALLLAGVVPVIGMVTVRNYVVSDDLVLLTSNAGKNLFIGNNSEATGTYCSRPILLVGSSLRFYKQGLKRGPDDPKASEVSRMIARRAWEFCRENPRRAIELVGVKLRLFFYAVEIGINDHFYFAKRFSTTLRLPLLTFGIIAPIGLTGAVFAMRQRRKSLLLLTVVVTQVAAFAIMFVIARYRLVTVACLMVFAGGQVAWWVDHLRRRRYRDVGWSFLLLAVFAAAVHLPMEGFDTEYGLGQQYAKVGVACLQHGDGDGAVRAFQQATECNFRPWNTEPALRGRCYVHLGDLYSQRGQEPEAVRMYELAIRQYEQMGDSEVLDSVQQWLIDRLRESRDRMSSP